MRKVLIPTDFSDNAFNALKYACQIFKYETSEFYIMHAYADDVYNQDIDTDRSLLEVKKEECFQESEIKLKNILVDIKKYSPNPNHNYFTFSKFGSLIDETNDLVNEHNMDIVVMGTKGKTNDRHLTFGSHTLQVLKYIQSPVLAIPENYEYKAPKEMLFPTNYLVPNKRRELKLLCEITASFRSSIHLLYIDPIKVLTLRQEDNLEFIKNSLKKAKIITATSAEKNKAKAITNFITEHQIDMLVMVHTRHSYLEDMLYQSTIDKIGLYIKIPFLIFQNLAR